VSKGPIYIHTNIASPYRRHQFEAVATAFPGSRVFFSEGMHADRPWEDGASQWKVQCRRFRHHVVLPKLGMVTPGLIPELLRQPEGTVHLVAASPGNVLLLRLLGRRRGGRLVFWTDGGFAESVALRHRRRFARWLRPAFCAAFSPGEIGRTYCRNLGFSDQQIFNAYLSHDVLLYDRLRREKGPELRRAMRGRLGIAADDFVMISVSRFLELKRLEDLSDALLSLDGRAGGDVHLVLVGDGPHQRPLEQMRAGLRNIRLHHIPSVAYNDMPEWYVAADLSVFPSEGDIWGLVVNEALSMGVPVICTSRIGGAELVRDGENGFRVPVRSPGKMAARIWQLYRDRALLQRMKGNATSIVDSWNTDLAVRELQRLAAM